MKIGILGGSFNPPHFGHFVMAQFVLDRLGLDKIIFVPCNKPPHKVEKDMVSPDLRLKMIKASIIDNTKFEVSDLELIRKGVSYTIDTLKQLKQIYLNDEFYLIIGSDLFKGLDSWRDLEGIKKLAKIVVATRGSSDLSSGKGFIFVDFPFIDISSSFVRKNIKKGYSVKYLVNDKVLDIICRNKLYI